MTRKWEIWQRCFLEYVPSFNTACVWSCVAHSTLTTLPHLHHRFCTPCAVRILLQHKAAVLKTLTKVMLPCGEIRYS